MNTITNSINTIYNKFLPLLPGSSTGSTYNQWPMAPYCDEAKFIVSNPDANSSITIVTTPAVGNPTYTQNTVGPVVVNMVQSYPQDFYTNGIHTFTFTLLGKK